MHMSRYLLVRVLVVSALMLVAALALAAWRAQFDVKREELGAAEVVRLFERLYTLENGPRDDVDATLGALQRIQASGALRHVRLDLRDALGHALIEPAAEAAPTWLQRGFALVAPGLRSGRRVSSGPWTLHRDDGAVYVATLSLDPASEQHEAFDNLLGVLGLLVGYGVAVLLAVTWALRRALAPLQPILGAIGHYERNDFSHRLPSLPFREMDTIARALNHLAATLDATQAERRALSLKLVSSQEDERARIARELHDECGQGLTAMRADAAWLLRKSRDQPELHVVLQGVAQQCEHLHLGIRDLLSDLRVPRARDGDGGVPLRRLIEDLLHGWSARPDCTARFALNYELDASALSEELAIVLYRLTQEALTNVVRHAAADSIEVTLGRDADGAVYWSLADDGIGIDALASAMLRGNGLAGMRERVWALGGQFDAGAANASTTRPGVRLNARFARGRGPA